MRTIFYIVMAASLVTQLHGRLTPDRPESKPSKKLTFMQSINRTISDFFNESLGIQAPSEANELFIRNIISELNMDDYCIEIRKMSNHAQIQIFGRVNAFVLPTSFLNKRSHAYLYISEDWFDTLSTEAKEGLIKHELMHLKHNHAGKRFLFSLVSIAAFSALFTYLENSTKDTELYAKNPLYKSNSTNINPYLAAAFASIPVVSYYSRLAEKEADIEAAKTMTNKNGLVDLFKDMKAETKDPKSKFAIKRFVRWMFKPLRKMEHLLAGTHPKLNDRIEYIQDLA